ncbi:MAG: guanylate kinase [Phycisphaerales bacterium]|nr:guanylate kinase [Phycisphaerales bacterium]
MSASSRPGLLLIISGPSGVGKTTLIERLHDKFDFAFSVSATTRARTEKEREGVDYFFLDEPTFKRWISEGRFLEYAHVFDKYWYGTPRQPVQEQLDAGRIVVLDIEVQGAEQVRAHMPDSFGVFVLPPSEEELHQRLIDRKRDAPEVIERRFAQAREEIAIATAAGQHTYDAHIVNDDLDRATQELDRLLTERLDRIAGSAGG